MAFIDALHVLASLCSRDDESRLVYTFADAVVRLFPVCRVTFFEMPEVLYCVKDERLKGKHRRTWLMAAAAVDDIALARRLLLAGADSNLSEYRGDIGRHGKPITQGTALTIAAANGHAGVVNVLLEHGADAHIGLDEYKAGTYRAGLRAHPGIVELLCNVPGVSCSAAIDFAFELRVPRVVRAKLAEDPMAWSKAEIEEQLLDSLGEDDPGAPATMRALAEHAPTANILRITTAGHMQDVAWLRELWDQRELLAASLHVVREGDGSHWAWAGDGGEEDEGFPAPHGAGVVVANWFLVAAAAAGVLDLVHSCLEMEGVDVNVRVYGSCSVEIAAHFQHPVVVQLLCAHETIDLANALAASSVCGLVEVARSLIDRGANVDGYGNQPLAAAIHGEHVAMVRLLSSHGASTTIEDVTGHDNALARACGRGLVEVVRVLLEFRVSDVNVRHGPVEACCPANTTPLMRAAKGRENCSNWRVPESERLEVIRILLNHGADPTLQNQHGDAALDVANGTDIKLMLFEANRAFGTPAVSQPES